jgi:SAM-dependent methyltransferase
MSESERTLVLRLRASRSKAREVAVAEVVAILRGLGARAASGGPMSEIPAVAWVTVPAANLESAISRLHGIGYTESIDLVAPREDLSPRDRPLLTRWRGREVALLRVYEESDERLRANAPDQRTFLLECGDGIVRAIEGYRGGSGILEHRALPVADARLLVNLVTSHGGASLLDPFAGAGGVILEANSKGFTTVSMDRDPVLRFGLAQMSSRHVVGDASALPFDAGSFDAVATEPPYHESALDSIVASIGEVARVLRHGGRIAYLVASEQTTAVRSGGDRAGLTLELAAPINRKGLEVTCIYWAR